MAYSNNLQACQSQGKSTFIIGDIHVDFLSNINQISETFELYGLKNIITGPTCFKSKANPTSLDVILTDSTKRIKSSLNVGNGISDFHNVVSVSTKLHAPVMQAKEI